MAEIKLYGKYAIGDHEFTIVDDDMVAELSLFRWKAKPNGGRNHVYAVRNVGNKTLRMHREVLRYSGPLEVDHINRNALDNRRENLRVVTRFENAANTVDVRVGGVCSRCGLAFERLASLVGPGRRVIRFCSRACAERGASVPKTEKACVRCGSRYLTHHKRSRFCGERCRKADKAQRQIECGALSPSRSQHV